MDVAYARFTMIDQSGMSPLDRFSFAYAHHRGPLATVASAIKAAAVRMAAGGLLFLH